MMGRAKFKSILRGSFLALAIFLMFPAQKELYGQSRRAVTEIDKARIIRSMLRTILAEQGKSDRNPVLLALEEPTNLELPSDLNSKIKLVEESEAHQRLQTKEGISYYSIKKLEVRRGKVIAYLWYKSGFKYGHTESVREYEYRKINGLWRGKETGQMSMCGASVPEKTNQ
jgi:hypothetical protein